jgi:SAM-dependent methyltransferase
MDATYDQARQAARAKAEQADYGSPFRYELTRRAPALIAAHCPNPATVLDVGCGSGRYALFFIEAGIHGQYVGVDISQERWDDLPLPPELPGRRVQLDAHELASLDDRFDFVISLTAYEHFADDAKVARGMAAVMKPGAAALVAVPATWSFPLYGPHGFRRYTGDSVRRLARQAGLEVVTLQAVGGPAGWLFHFLWFFPATVLRLGGKALLYGAAAGDRTRVRARFPRLVNWLDGLGNHHLKWAWGRALHRACLRAASALDGRVPLLSVGWLTLLRKP